MVSFFSQRRLLREPSSVISNEVQRFEVTADESVHTSLTKLSSGLFDSLSSSCYIARKDLQDVESTFLQKERVYDQQTSYSM